MAIEIELTNSTAKCLIDECDFELVSRYKWYEVATQWVSYARSTSRTKETGNQELMHRLILRPKHGEEVDHKNSQGLDNRRENIRICTSVDNRGNTRKQHGTSSKYKGVCWDSSKSKWVVHIHRRDKQYFLGYFDDEDDAGKAYDEAAKEYFGEYARTNF